MKASVSALSAEAPSKLCDAPRQLSNAACLWSAINYLRSRLVEDKVPPPRARQINLDDKLSKAWRANIANVSGPRLPAGLHLAGLTDLASGTTDYSGFHPDFDRTLAIDNPSHTIIFTFGQPDGSLAVANERRCAGASIGGG